VGCCDKNSDEKKSVSEQNSNFVCPKCENKGAKIDIVTPKTMLTDCCKGKVQEETLYRFCKNEDCDVTYFSEDKEHYFNKTELKVKATLKDKGLDVSTCYCFGFTRQNILDEIKETGESTAVDTIKAKMKDPGCFCETSNPQGGCCLANNIAWVKEAKKMCSPEKDKKESCCG